MDPRSAKNPKIDWKRSVWQDRSRNAWAFLCPSCGTSRKIPFHPRPGGVAQVGRIALLAMVFTLATWRWFDWKGVVSFVPFWMVFEIYYRTRVRATLKCNGCGFDPFLYLIDVDRKSTRLNSSHRL